LAKIWSARSRARVDIRAGRPVGLSAEIDVTPMGLVAAGALVSAILMSTGVLIRTIRPVGQELRDQGNA
jgi:hypothetical protein